VQLTFDADVEAFRAEFIRFLDEHLPAEAEAAAEQSRSTAHVPEWARHWQQVQFDHGWLLPGNPPEFGGRNAGILEQFVHREELSRRRIYHAFNPQGVGIIAASLLSFGTDEQKRRWAVPILRAEMTASLGMSEPGAGSDLAGLKTRAVQEGDVFVVNGQKVWTSGAHDADVILAFVRTDPDAPKHKGISALLIPTDSPGVERRPFASVHDREGLDFNEVFFTDVRVPAENLVGPLHEGWRVANGSLGHERTMMWMAFANRRGEPRPVRHDRDGLPGAAATRVQSAGAGRAGRARHSRRVGAEAVRVGGRAEGPGVCAGRRGCRGLAQPDADRAVQPLQP
jgi:alkylation response protein AidB-like acyl-CoA dehydrogenase